MLKLYTNTRFLTAEHRKDVFPLLLDVHFLKNEKLTPYFCLVEDVLEADIVVFPIQYHKFIQHKKSYEQLNALAKKYAKSIWVYTAGDFGYTLNQPNVFNFRLGGFDSKLNKKTIIVPALIQDPYSSYLKTNFTPLQKEEQPTLGFVGHAKGGIVKYIKEYVNYLKINTKRILKNIKFDYQNFYPSGVIRANYLNQLAKNTAIKSNFILRNQYRAGVKTAQEKQQTTLAFYNNMHQNIYTFCMRGGGNFSVRFYETLAMGRIPVLLDTDCRLPLSNLINWENHCVIIKDMKNKDIGTQLVQFHKLKTAAEIEEIQINNRALWFDFLRRDTFFMHVANSFKTNNHEI